MKTCSKCGVAKSEDNFCKQSKAKDGLQSQCKKCKSDAICEYHKTSKGKSYRKKHRREWERSYAKRNREKMREKSLRSYHRNKVAFNMSRSMRRCLNGKKDGCKWESLAGYNLQDLRDHLESLFEEGMTWDNYGEWHIDHKKPISKFNITDYECKDFKECWSLKNLQPLWAKDNLIKGNRAL